jgi:hypothetical protein
MDPFHLIINFCFIEIEENNYVFIKYRKLFSSLYTLGIEETQKEQFREFSKAWDEYM